MILLLLAFSTLDYYVYGAVRETQLERFVQCS